MQIYSQLHLLQQLLVLSFVPSSGVTALPSVYFFPCHDTFICFTDHLPRYRFSIISLSVITFCKAHSFPEAVPELIVFFELIQPHLKSFLRTSAETNMFIERMRFRPLHTALKNHLVAVVCLCNVNGFLDHLFSKSLLPIIFVSNNIFYEAYRTAAFCQVWNYDEIACRDNFSIINGTDILYIFIRFNFIPDIPGFLQADVRIIFIKLNV